VWDASDEALLAGFATGDPEAAGAFVRRFQHRVIGLASLITRDAADAEEVAQDAFVRAWRYAASYDPRRGSVPSWLLGIVRNVAVDRVRVSSRRRERELDDTFADGWLEQLPDAADAIVDRDAAAPVVAAMQVLPPEQRQALMAVTFYGLTARELSQATHVPLGTAKSRIRLGLRRLREQLGVRTG
jgi:RNA polymerase sigma-70 factor (ECF subfamily)